MVNADWIIRNDGCSLFEIWTIVKRLWAGIWKTSWFMPLDKAWSKYQGRSIPWQGVITFRLLPFSSLFHCLEPFEKPESLWVSKDTNLRQDFFSSLFYLFLIQKVCFSTVSESFVISFPYFLWVSDLAWGFCCIFLGFFPSFWVGVLRVCHIR